MKHIILTTIACIIAASLFRKVLAWRKNLKAAQTAGFPTFYSPVHIQDVWWLTLHKFLVPYLELLPKSWKQPWLPLGQLWRIWHVGYKPFEEVGSDTIILATPNGNVLWTCDPAVVKQLFSSPTVEIPVEVMKFVNIWGPTVSTVGGDEWKLHRRAIAYGLNPSINTTVWKEAIHQTNGLIDHWIQNHSVVPVIEHWTSRLVLHVSSSVLFNQRIDWTEDPGNVKSQSDHVSCETALFTVIDRMGLIFVVPRVFLKFPIKSFRKVHRSLTALTKYMQDMLSSTTNRIDEVANKPTKSLLESIVIAGTPGPHQPEARPLPEESVMGNLFVTLVSGYHTSGNTLAFALLLLAIYPEYQTEIQTELDRHFGDRPQHQWSVEHDYPALQKGFLGAVLKEVLRLYCVIEFIFRITLAPTTVNDSTGRQHTIPQNTTCVINFSAALQNPSVWPQQQTSAERRTDLHNSHAIDFDPRRWLGDTVDPTSYWPFGLGFRKCPGKPFAETVMVGTLATLLKSYSVELVVDERILRDSNGDQKEAWGKARDQAMRKLEDDIKVNLNVSMTEELPIRITRRG
ncbi:cytochrome P450 [Zopfia rhizophila CBS 207.26]|uniref:Cytochrome P450 n=1 Tax=Zopfia rhizophila CBS 207.26 TaxID=1314779 RepID=A0A6A6E6M7_9PEZI|nr:cytochrome P450 [Zopfia rhizophila CBS 207.26]